ncbi:MAG: cytochrome C oxidase subunit IV family protein [Jhaorihella sp.]
MEKRLATAWVLLLALSLGSALLTLAKIEPRLTGAAILILALLKARVILGRYLDLDTAPSWRRGFMTVLGGFALLVYGLYLV